MIAAKSDILHDDENDSQSLFPRVILYHMRDLWGQGAKCDNVRLKLFVNSGWKRHRYVININLLWNGDMKSK